MKNKDGSDLKRVQFDLSPKSFTSLTQVKQDINASTYAEVVKRALQVLEVIVEAEKNGQEFYLKDKDGKLTKLLVLL